MTLDSIVSPIKNHVVKRNGNRERTSFDKITSRIEKLCYSLHPEYVDATVVTQKVIVGIYPGITTVELDNLAAETAANMATIHPDYAILAARIAISNLHKETKKRFSDVMTDLYTWVNPLNSKNCSMISDKTYEVISKYKDTLDSAIVYDRDFGYSFFGFKTLERSYLLKINGKIAERPQHMLMRVACGIHGDDLKGILDTYKLLSQRWFTFGSPTLFNSGTRRPQMSSCFLLNMQSDSIDGIYNTLTQCAKISKSAGGIGLAVHNIRAKGSYIAGTNGHSNGLVPMLRVYNNTARYVDQGGNKRPGAFAVYLEPWHADIFDFIDLKKNTGKEEVRARDLFYALWVPDLFMERVKNNQSWSLFCPDDAKGLSECYGDEFEKLYTKYEKGGLARKTIKAQDLWKHIIDCQIETGTPYMCYKDAANRKSNQKNLGTIKSSNLCTEIMEYTDDKNIAVCNLASIALPRYIDQKTKKFDFDELHKVTKQVVKCLNKIIDVNYYPVEEARFSNMQHRPIGIGVQGLADTFQILDLPFDSPEARTLNKQIFETIYHASVESSMDLSRELGPYSSYEGSPISQGILQFDMWNKKPEFEKWNWNTLKAQIKEHGVRNSLLLAPMPTASTAQILGNNESIEPYTSNIYSRRVLSGEFQVVNQHLLTRLVEEGIWSEDIKLQMIANMGSIQNIENIPDHIKKVFRTVWEISQKSIVEMAADRGPFICQSQSLNIHIAKPNLRAMSSMHFTGWSLGLKTGMYYLRTRPAVNAIQFTVDKAKLAQITKNRTNSGTVEADKENKKPSSSLDALKKTGYQEGQTNDEISKVTKKLSLLGQENKKVENEVTEESTPTPSGAGVQLTEEDQARILCSLENKEACMMCSG